MPTTNPRVHVTFDSTMYNALNGLAGSTKRSVSNVVRDLVYEAMELHEDLALAKLADQRMRGKPKLIKLDKIDWGD